MVATFLILIPQVPAPGTDPNAAYPSAAEPSTDEVVWRVEEACTPKALSTALDVDVTRVRASVAAGDEERDIAIPIEAGADQAGGLSGGATAGLAIASAAIALGAIALIFRGRWRMSHAPDPRLLRSGDGGSSAAGPRTKPGACRALTVLKTGPYVEISIASRI